MSFLTGALGIAGAALPKALSSAGKILTEAKANSSAINAMNKSMNGILADKKLDQSLLGTLADHFGTVSGKATGAVKETSAYGGLISTFAGEAADKGISLITDSIANRNRENLAMRLGESHPLTGAYRTMNEIRGLGMTPGDVKTLTDIDIARNNLAKSNTLMSKMQRTSLGQFGVPLAAAAAVSATSGIASRLGNTAAAITGFQDPTVTLAVNSQLRRVLEVEPRLQDFDLNQIRSYFMVAYKRAPEIMNDPRVAANILLGMLGGARGGDHMFLQQLAKSEKDVTSNGLGFTDAFGMGTKMLG